MVDELVAWQEVYGRESPTSVERREGSEHLVCRYEIEERMDIVYGRITEYLGSDLFWFCIAGHSLTRIVTLENLVF